MVFDEFVGPSVVNFSDMVYDVCIVCMMILTRSLAFKSKAVRLYEKSRLVDYRQTWRTLFAFFSGDLLQYFLQRKPFHNWRFIVLRIWSMLIQALTNKILSNVCSRTRVLHYLFVNILPYQNICRV